nr:MAG TPA: YsxB-like protein [Caudoviricetes sp.]
MVTIVFTNHDGVCTGLEALGHAGYGEIGKDIVCAAVSALIQGAVLSIEQLAEKPVVQEKEEGRISYHIRDPDEVTQVLFASLELSLAELQAEYRNYLTVCHG